MGVQVCVGFIPGDASHNSRCCLTRLRSSAATYSLHVNNTSSEISVSKAGLRDRLENSKPRYDVASLTHSPAMSQPMEHLRHGRTRQDFDVHSVPEHASITVMTACVNFRTTVVVIPTLFCSAWSRYLHDPSRSSHVTATGRYGFSLWSTPDARCSFHPQYCIPPS